MSKLDPLEASLKAAAVSGIFMLWANLTIKAFNFLLAYRFNFVRRRNLQSFF